jgi:hypothetical protein
LGQEGGGDVRVNVESLAIVFEGCDQRLKLADSRTRLSLSLVSCSVAGLVVEVFDGGFIEKSTFVIVEAIKIAILSKLPGV